MNEILTAIMENGWDVHMGRHDGIPGFFAAVYDPHLSQTTCSECESPIPMSWVESGHGLTMKAALLNAIDVYNGTDTALPRANFAANLVPGE